MTAIAQALSAALLNFVWQGLLAAFLLWSVLWALRNRSARARYAASCASLAVMALIPVVTACLAYRESAPQLAGWPAAIRATFPSGTPAPSAFRWKQIISGWALPLWSLGVLLFSLRLVWASRQLSALRQKARPAEAAIAALVAELAERMQLPRTVRVLISAVPDCPSVAGWIKPVVLLPAATLLSLTPQQLEAVLAHELAHILRHDYLVNMLQSIVEALLFYHPAVWWVSTRIRHERELCCDDLAVASCGDAICYARALTRLERLRVAPPHLALGSAAGPLMYRIQRLTGDAGWRRGPSTLPGILALSLGLLCFALNVQWARAQQSEVERAAVALTRDEPVDPGVRIDLRGADVTYREGVDYPASAVRKNIGGTAVVEATVGGDGSVTDARVLSGPPELRKAALESILQWRFSKQASGGARQVDMTFDPQAAAVARRSPDRLSSRLKIDALLQSREAQELLSARLQERIASDLAGTLQRQASQYAVDVARGSSHDRELSELRSLQLEHILEQAKAAELLANADRGLLSRHAADLAGAQAAAQALQQALRGPDRALAAEDRARMALDAAKLLALRDDLDALRPPPVGLPKPAFAGRKLKSIDTQGVDAAVREQLMAKLPFHAGDTLDADSFDAIETIVKQFDDRLGLSARTVADGQVEIRITASDPDDRLPPQ